MLNFFKSLPVQLVFFLILAFSIGDILPLDWVRAAFTVSTLLKDLLMVLLPLVVFSYISSGLMSFEEKAPLLILALLVAVSFSNALAVSISYGVGALFLPHLTSGVATSFEAPVESIAPFFSLPIKDFLSPTFYSADKAMVLGLIVGLFGAFKPSVNFQQKLFKLRDTLTTILQKTFIPFLPLYVFGFVLKLDREDSLDLIIDHYGVVFILTLVLMLSYTVLLYFIAGFPSFKKFKDSLKNMLPAGLTGFSTMSSAAAMPVTLEASHKNIDDKNFVNMVVPATTNMHLLGDGLSIPIAVLFVLLISGQPLPDVSQYAVFVAFYCLTKFSAAGIPGGGVLVLLPVFQKYLGLSSEMASLVATLYILQDPLFTAFNVMGNGAFAMILKKVFNPFLKKTSSPHTQKTEDVSCHVS